MCVNALRLTHVRRTRPERLHSPTKHLKLSFSELRSAATGGDRVAVLRHVDNGVWWEMCMSVFGI